MLVRLRAFLTYTEDPKKQAVHAVSVRILEPERTAGEELLERIREEIRTYDGGNRTKESVRLPEEVGGKEIRYHLPMDPRGGVVLVMGILTAALLVCLEKQNEKKEGERRRQQMMLDYPQIVSQLNLLLGAGMSSKSAWKKIVDDYQQRRQTSGTRAAYEEMCAAWNEMCGGVPEKECYENFGSRCALQAYMKLGALLSQNLRKGDEGGWRTPCGWRGSTPLRRGRPWRSAGGEEAGTKLLLPMFLMLAVVLVIVIVPAFLSIPL